MRTANRQRALFKFRARANKTQVDNNSSRYISTIYKYDARSSKPDFCHCAVWHAAYEQYRNIWNVAHTLRELRLLQLCNFCGARHLNAVCNTHIHRGILAHTLPNTRSKFDEIFIAQSMCACVCVCVSTSLYYALATGILALALTNGDLQQRVQHSSQAHLTPHTHTYIQCELMSLIGACLIMNSSDNPCARQKPKCQAAARAAIKCFWLRSCLVSSSTLTLTGLQPLGLALS